MGGQNSYWTESLGKPKLRGRRHRSCSGNKPVRPELDTRMQRTEGGREVSARGKEGKII